MLTLGSRAELERSIRNSRFIAFAQRVESEADCLEFHEAVADPDANHNCWAWRLGGRYRFSDDGEPGSSAGRPILSAIEGADLDQCMVVVTRYFGGTKLGIGGLIRAYGGTAAQCLDQAEIIELKPTMTLRIRVPFEHVSDVHRLVADTDGEVQAEDYSQAGACITVEIESGRNRKLEKALADATRGVASVRRVMD